VGLGPAGTGQSPTSLLCW